jgi:hypothetical protein
MFDVPGTTLLIIGINICYALPAFDKTDNFKGYGTIRRHSGIKRAFCDPFDRSV